MPSDDREFAFSSRVPPKALKIKAPYKSWHYQRSEGRKKWEKGLDNSGNIEGNSNGLFTPPRGPRPPQGPRRRPCFTPGSCVPPSAPRLPRRSGLQPSGTRWRTVWTGPAALLPRWRTVWTGPAWTGPAAQGILHALQREFYTLNGMRDTSAARTSPTSRRVLCPKDWFLLRVREARPSGIIACDSVSSSIVSHP
jgi:hypothetical protein